MLVKVHGGEGTYVADGNDSATGCEWHSSVLIGHTEAVGLGGHASAHLTQVGEALLVGPAHGLEMAELGLDGAENGPTLGVAVALVRLRLR